MILKKAIKAINNTVFIQIKERKIIIYGGRKARLVCFKTKGMGVPLPIFVNKKTQEPLRDKKVIERIASI